MTDTRMSVFEHGQLPGALELALVGDSVYDLYVRSHLVRKGGRVKDIHKNAVMHVNAHAQAMALDRIEEMLTEEEAGVVRRARNAKQTPTKNADAGDYHKATALEALLGYLYLTGQTERLNRFLSLCTNMEG